MVSLEIFCRLYDLWNEVLSPLARSSLPSAALPQSGSRPALKDVSITSASNRDTLPWVPQNSGRVARQRVPKTDSASVASAVGRSDLLIQSLRVRWFYASSIRRMGSIDNVWDAGTYSASFIASIIARIPCVRFSISFDLGWSLPICFA